MKKFWMPLAFAATLSAGIILGWMLSRQNRVGFSSEDKLLHVFDLIQNEYVDEVDIDSLVEMTIPLMLENLDPHSAYIPAKDLTSVNEELDGKFSGIGISFRIHNDTLNVMEVISGGPSEKVGILAGDRIIKVDGEDIAGKGIKDEEVMKMLRGEKGTKVTLTVKRASSKKPLTFDVTRDDIPVESIDASYMLNDSTGYVKVSRFGRTTYREFLQALNSLRLQGAQSFVVDLRSNTGGYMEPAVMMVNEFLPYGKTIVSTKGRDSGQNDILISDGTGAFQDFGLTVILNELSASASEIFSGAVQDNDR
ncbi:MAG: PDZ domain-containing protein, partial [Muribaculaceae bacterium]|nr:PDZ domain-containing protein [Muribaculaceae bacterium]